MKRLLTTLGCLALLNLVFLTPAQALNVCIKNKAQVTNGAIKFAKSVRLIHASCPSGYTEASNLDNDFIAFARVAADGSIRSFGGVGVKTVTGSIPETGKILVTFQGAFKDLEATPSVANDQKLTVLSTPKTSGFVASNAVVQSASRTSISVELSTWQVNTLSRTVEDDVSIAILR